MPASTDLVSRAFDLKVRCLIKDAPEYENDLITVINKIKLIYPNNYEIYIRRINIGAEKSFYFIKNEILKGKSVESVDYVGEKNKGINDADIIINFTNGHKLDISLKFYKKKGSFNFWNPTLDSLFKHLTGKKLIDYLNTTDLKRYLKDMISLKNINLSSKNISPFWVSKATSVLKNYLQGNEDIFRFNLINKLGYSSVIVTCIVDEKGVFKDLINIRPRLIEKLKKGEGILKIENKGISIFIYLDGDILTNLAVYAQSDSKGRSGGLRIAAWTPFN